MCESVGVPSPPPLPGWVAGTMGVLGDLDVISGLQSLERACEAGGVTASHYLWNVLVCVIRASYAADVQSAADAYRCDVSLVGGSLGWPGCPTVASPPPTMHTNTQPPPGRLESVLVVFFVVAVMGSLVRVGMRTGWRGRSWAVHAS